MRVRIEVVPCPRCETRFWTKFPAMDEEEQRCWLVAEMLTEPCCPTAWRIVRAGDDTAFSDLPDPATCKCGRSAFWGCSGDGGWSFQKCASYLRGHENHTGRTDRTPVCESCLIEPEDCKCDLTTLAHLRARSSLDKYDTKEAPS